MSDVPRGPGWWIASDDRWYPPEAHPSNAVATQGGPGPAAGPQVGPGGAVASTRPAGERTPAQQLRNAGLLFGGALLVSLGIGWGISAIVDVLDEDQREACELAESNLTMTLDGYGVEYWPPSGSVEEFTFADEPGRPDASVRVDHVGPPEAPTGYTLTGVDECEGYT